ALGLRHYQVISPEQIFDDRHALGGVGEACPGVSGSPTFLGPLAASGNKRRIVLAVTSAFQSIEGSDCRHSRSITARIDNADVQSWIAMQIEQWLGPQH